MVCLPLVGTIFFPPPVPLSGHFLTFYNDPPQPFFISFYFYFLPEPASFASGRGLVSVLVFFGKKKYSLFFASHRIISVEPPPSRAGAGVRGLSFCFSFGTSFSLFFSPLSFFSLFLVPRFLSLFPLLFFSLSCRCFVFWFCFGSLFFCVLACVVFVLVRVVFSFCFVLCCVVFVLLLLWWCCCCGVVLRFVLCCVVLCSCCVLYIYHYSSKFYCTFFD